MKQIPEFITFTGIDDRTDLARADRLASDYPIEWGVLVSVSNKDARFPCSQAIGEILTISGKKSAHLCGRAARDLQAGSAPRHVPFEAFDRIQVNGRNINTDRLADLPEEYGVQVILQSVTNEFTPGPFLQLFDRSGGEGMFPEEVPSLPGEGVFVGYAGGMGPESVGRYLELIHGEGSFWIDMEGRLRTKGWFDLDKVARVCEQVYG